jgi:hypothetical protein
VHKHSLHRTVFRINIKDVNVAFINGLVPILGMIGPFFRSLINLTFECHEHKDYVGLVWTKIELIW